MCSARIHPHGNPYRSTDHRRTGRHRTAPISKSSDEEPILGSHPYRQVPILNSGFVLNLIVMETYYKYTTTIHINPGGEMVL